jgi:endonuclease-3
MNRQVKADVAWMIPYKICAVLEKFEIEVLASKPESEYIKLFKNHSPHRFNDKMARIFYSAIQHIVNEYGGEASRIWANKSSSASVVYRFLQFEGVGAKITTMAANILATRFKVPFSDYYSIDIPPDIHIKRVFRRTGLVGREATKGSIIYKSRELYPEFQVSLIIGAGKLVVLGAALKIQNVLNVESNRNVVNGVSSRIHSSSS